MITLDINDIKAEAQKRIEESLVAELELVNITYAKLGGYNGRTYSNELQLAEFLRTQSIKGVWRWWIRAILAGAAWEMGINDVDYIIKYTKKIMGSTESASPLILRLILEDMVDNWKGKGKSLIYIKNILQQSRQNGKRFTNILPPRLGLLVMGKKSEEEEFEILYIYPVESLKGRIQILRTGSNISNDEINVAIGALLLALILQGVGAITRRGFGHFKITLKKDSPNKTYAECIKQLNEEVDAAKIESALCKLIDEVIGCAKKLLQTHAKNLLQTQGSIRGIPPYPSLSCKCQAFKLTVKKINTRSEGDNFMKSVRYLGLSKGDEAQLKLLRKLGQATLKIKWKKRPNISGRNLDTWILGLPRSNQANKTGYFLRSTSPTQQEVGRRPSSISFAPLKQINDDEWLVAIEVGRRPSSISFAPLKQINDDEWLVAIYGFISSDWPDRIEWWSGKIDKNIEPKNEVQKCFDTAFNQVINYLCRGVV